MDIDLLSDDGPDYNELAERTQLEYLFREEITALNESGFRVIEDKGSRVCDDCDELFPFHSWITVRCTLDNEDVTKHYCFDCYLNRMRVYVAKLAHIVTKTLTPKNKTNDQK